MLSDKYRNVVVLCVLDLIDKFDVGFIVVEDLSISHQPDRLGLSNLSKNSLEGQVVISQNVKVTTLNQRGLDDVLINTGEDSWFEESGGEDGVLEGTMRCFDLLVDKGIKIITGLKLDRRKENLTLEGYGDSKTKSELWTSFSYNLISREDLRSRVKLILESGT